MVERNVLGSNWLRFLAATTGVMIGPLSRIPNAQEATAYDEGMNKIRKEGREQNPVCGQLASKVKLPTLLISVPTATVIPPLAPTSGRERFLRLRLPRFPQPLQSSLWKFR